MRATPSSRHPNAGMMSIIAIPALLLALALGIQATQAAHAGGTPPGPIKVTSVEHHTLGIPAITPRADMATTTGPRFTAAEVTQYVAANPQVLGVPTGHSVPTVTSVQFVSAKQASALLQGESIGLPDAAPVCVVQLHGYFVFTYGPPGVTGPTNYDTKTVVFDAQNGNLLIG